MRHVTHLVKMLVFDKENNSDPLQNILNVLFPLVTRPQVTSSSRNPFASISNGLISRRQCQRRTLRHDTRGKRFMNYFIYQTSQWRIYGEGGRV